MLLLLFGRYAFGLFSRDAAVIETGMRIIRVTFPFYWLYVILEVHADALRGSGNSVQPMIIILACMCVLRTALLAVFTGIWDSLEAVAAVYPSAWLGAPCIIGPETEVRHCAFIRGSALVGANCVVGNSVELKNVILFDNVQTPHYNYVGDSILGYKSHMGAGSITSNVKSDKTLVVVKGETPIPTGRKKMGAILGDFVEVGCNSVLNPGTILGRHSSVYPTSCVRGVVPANSIWKTGGVIAPKR